MKVSKDRLQRIMNDELYTYQREGVEIMSKRRHNLNFDDMGLGKTVATLYTLIARTQEEDLKTGHKCLIVCPTKAIGVWRQELWDWFEAPSLIYSGTPAQRKKLRALFSEYRFIITTYGMLKELGDILWYDIICDEIHEAGLLNYKTKTYDKLSHMIKPQTSLWLLTGTPVRQGVIDLYAPLHLVDPVTFRAYWPFVNKYCITEQTPFGKEIQRNPRDIKGFRKLLDRYMIRRIKSEVLSDLPGKQRQIIPIQMTARQAKAHQDIMNEFVYADDDTIVVTPNAMTAILRCRQLLVTPRLLGIDEDGAAFDYLKDEGMELMRQGKPFVVYTPFREAVPLIKDLFLSCNHSIKIFTLMGGLNPNEFANQWQGFMEWENSSKILICVIKSGASFHATCASDCFFVGYEWDFNLDAQAEDRLCRIGQKNFVHCRYLLHQDTVDELLKEKLNMKNDASNWIIGTEQQYQYMLKRVRPKVMEANYDVIKNQMG